MRAFELWHVGLAALRHGIFGSPPGVGNSQFSSLLAPPYPWVQRLLVTSVFWALLELYSTWKSLVGSYISSAIPRQSYFCFSLLLIRLPSILLLSATLLLEYGRLWSLLMDSVSFYVCVSLFLFTSFGWSFGRKDNECSLINKNE